jgi:phage terminase large subunit-like protein
MPEQIKTIPPEVVTPEELRRADLEYKYRRKKEKEDCERSYEQFVRSAWHVLEPGTPLLWNWHLSYLCEEAQTQMERIARREPRKYHLCINVPPSSLKSMIFTRMANAWAWVHWPWMRFIAASYAISVSEEHALDTKMLIKSGWYQEYWKDKYQIVAEQDAKSFFRTNQRGQRQITSTGGSFTGKHAHIVILDDLIDPKGGRSEAEIKEADLFYRRTAQSRFINANVGMFWNIQQRVAVSDTTGLIKEREGKKYKIICLPSEETEDVNPKQLRKFYVNGLLFPEKFTRQFCDEQKQLDPVGYATQYLQRPSPEEGNIFKRKNWRYWIPAGVELNPVVTYIGTERFVCPNVVLPKSFDTIINSWDFAFGDKETNDKVSGDVWGSSGANCYLLDNSYGLMDFSKSSSSMVKTRKKWPLTSKILIEEKANGAAIINSFKEIIPGIFPVPANKGDSPKTKALIVSRKQECGNVILPHPELPGYAWVKEYVDEYSDYTGDDTCKNDRVASGCQAVVHLTQAKPIFEHYSYRPVEIKVEWRELKKEMNLYCSVWVEPDLITSAIIAVWNQRTGMMAILDEYIASTPMPEAIRVALETKVTRLTGGVLTNLDRFTWIGNPLMFARKDNARSYHTNAIKDGVSESYTRIGISVQDNLSFEERGAITIADKLFLSKAVLIDHKASETGRQPAAWCYDGKDPAAGYGCARALINLCSAVSEDGKRVIIDRRIPEYSPDREIINNEINREANAEKMGQFIRTRPEVSNERAGAVGDNERWMV